MFPDGICRVNPGYFTKTIQFQDINYQLNQNEDKTAIFEGWCDFLNYFDSSVKFELSFMNMAANKETYGQNIAIPPQDDDFGNIREEYTEMLRNQLARGNNGLIKTKYLTFGIEAANVKEAKPRLDRIETDRGCYVALLPVYDDSEEVLEGEDEVLPLKVIEEDGETYLTMIEDDDEFEEVYQAFEERLNQAMDSFMFRVHIAEQEFAMDAPQGQNQFFERCAEMLLELSDELERNLYIEAIVKEYGRYGVGTEDIRKRVNTLALKGTPAEKRIQPKSGTPETKKKESAADKAQKLMLTWLVNYPGIFEQVEKYISPSDFVVPLYKEVAQMLFDQHKEGETNPGKLLNAFTDSEEQREVASLFNATIHLENEGEQQRAFSDTLLRIKEESLKEKNRTWDPSDMAGLQELIKAKKELEDLGRKRQQLHISFN